MTNPNYNEIIKSARKAKALTQQELAELAGVSLRTVQRIEKGTEEISGFSIRQIAIVLDIPIENLIMKNLNQISIDPNQIGTVKVLYLSSITFILNPLFGFIVPAIIGFSKQNKTEFYNKELKKLLWIHGIPLILFCLWLAVFFLTAVFEVIPNRLFDIDSMNIFIFPIIYYPLLTAFIIINILRINKLK